MKKALQIKYALSEQSAKDLCKGILYSVLANFSLMLPVALLAVVLDALLAPLLGNSSKGVSVPLYWGSLISTAIVCIALLVYDWRMGLALLWVAPVAFAIVLLSRKLQTKPWQILRQALRCKWQKNPVRRHRYRTDRFRFHDERFFGCISECCAV